MNVVFFRFSEALLNMHPLPDRQDDMWIAGLISEFTDRPTRFLNGWIAFRSHSSRAVIVSISNMRIRCLATQGSRLLARPNGRLACISSFVPLLIKIIVSLIVWKRANSRHFSVDFSNQHLISISSIHIDSTLPLFFPYPLKCFSLAPLRQSKISGNN